MTTPTPQIDIYTQFVSFLEMGKTTEAREFIVKELPNLPEEMQGDILLALYASAAQDQVDRETIAQIQERGLAAIEAIEDAKKTIEEK